MPEIIRYERIFPLDDIEIQRGGDGRTVTAYAAVFDREVEIRDQHGHYFEDIHRGAFNKTLAEWRPGKVKVLYNHGYDADGQPNMVGSVPIATALEARVDGRGLLTVSRYNDSPMADAVLAAIKGGQITGQSFRGRVYQSKERGRRGGLPIVSRTELGLSEYGPTASPAYEDAGIVAVRSQPDHSELRELVRTLITEQLGTSLASAAQDGHPTVGPVTSEPAAGHSGRLHARRNSLRVRSILSGAISAQAPDRGGDRVRPGDLP